MSDLHLNVEVFFFYYHGLKNTEDVFINYNYKLWQNYFVTCKQ